MDLCKLSVLLPAFFAAALCATSASDPDGLLPPANLDRNPAVAIIRQAIALRDLAAARKKAADLLVREQPDSEAFFWTGYLDLVQGRYYDAIRNLRRAESLDPSPFVLKSLAASYYAAHQPRLFLLKMRAAQQKLPDDFAPDYYLGRYFDTDLSDFQQAARYFQQALARQPDHFRSHYYLGHCYEAEGKPEEAEAEYRRALELAENQPPADRALPNQGLARLRLSANLPAEAMEFAKRAVELSPRDAAGHKLLAKAYSELGQVAQAVPEWEISAELDPTDAVALYRLYRGYVSLGKDGEARLALEHYKKVAALYGTN